MSEFARGVRDSIIAVALTLILVLMTSSVPLLSVAGVIVCGVPMAFLAAKHKPQFSVLALLAVAGIFWAFLNSFTGALSMMLMLVIPGAVAGYMLGKKSPFFSAVLGVSVTVCVGWLFIMFILNTSVEGGIAGAVEALRPALQESLTQSLGQMDSLGMNGEVSELAAAVPDAVNMALVVFRLYLPSMIVISAAVLGYSVLRLSGFFVRITGAAEVNMVPFGMMKAPRSMSIAAVICYLISFFASAETAFGAVVANGALVLEFLLAVCGISFIDYQLKKSIRFAALRWLIYFGVFAVLFVTMLFPMVSYGFVIVGMLDAGRDFRRIGMYSDGEL